MSHSRTRLSVLRANLRSSGKRLWAAGAAIAISAAFFVAGSMLVSSMTAAVTEEAEQDAAGVDLIVSMAPADAGAAPPDDQLLAAEIEALDSVDSTEIVRTGWFDEMYEDEELYGQTRIGFPVSTLADSRPYELTAGELPQSAEEILINETVAEIHGLTAGDRLTASERSWDETEGYTLLDQEEFTVVGVTEAGPLDEGFLTAEGMERLPQEEEAGPAVAPEEIRVVLAGDAHRDQAAQEAVQEEIAELTDLSTATHQQIVDDWVAERAGDAQVLQWIAFGFGSIAIFVSALVIANTFQVIVASRLRTMALIRAVGGTAAQLRRATLAEGALLGLLGGAAGVLLGWGVAQGLVLVMNYLSSSGQGIPTVLPDPLTIGIGVGLGLLLAVCAALFPALKAGRVSPMAAMRPADVQAPESGVSRIRMLLGTVAAAGGIGMVVYAALGAPDTDRPEGSYGIFNADPVTGVPYPVLGVCGAIIGFIGVLALAKAVVPPLVGLLGKLLSALGVAAVPAKLAGQNARQVPGRTAATSAALLVGVTLVMTMTVGAATAQKLLYTELADSYPVDGVVAGSEEDYLTDLEDSEVVDEIAAMQGMQVETPDGTELPMLVMGREAADRTAHLPMDELEEAGPDVFVDWSLASQPEETDDGLALRLNPSDGGAATDFEVDVAEWVPPETVVILESALPEDWAADGDAGAMIQLVEDTTVAEIAALEAELDGADGPGLSLVGGTMRAELVQIIDTMLLAVIALLGASVFVALIGVSNTLSLSVFERKREAALLRASGMTRRSLGATISIEALLLAAVALALGTGLGVFYAWAGVSTLATRDDWTVVVEVPWLRLAVVWGVTLLAALAAAWLPARRLSKVQPAAGLSHAA